MKIGRWREKRSSLLQNVLQVASFRDTCCLGGNRVLNPRNSPHNMIQRPFLRYPRLHFFQYRLYASLSSSDNVSHYDVLGLNHNATPSQVKKSYYELAKKFHPDTNRNKPTDERRRAEKKYSRVKEAYDVLGTKEKRTLFDQELRQRHGSSSSPSRSARGTAHDQKYYGHAKYSGAHYTASSLHRRTRAQTHHFYNRHHQYAEKQKTNKDTEPIQATYRSGSNYDVPHFDFDKHYKQQRSYELHRKKMSEMRANAEIQGGSDGNTSSSYSKSRSDHDFGYHYNPYKILPKTPITLTPAGIVTLLGGFASIAYFIIKSIIS